MHKILIIYNTIINLVVFVIFSIFGGILTGIINGLLGAGGGMIAVPMLKRKIEPEKAHATSVAIILFICLFSAYNYYNNGIVEIKEVYPFLLWGLIGSMVGSWLLPKINRKWLRLIFSLFIIWAGIRMLLK